MNRHVMNEISTTHDPHTKVSSHFDSSAAELAPEGSTRPCSPRGGPSAGRASQQTPRAMQKALKNAKKSVQAMKTLRTHTTKKLKAPQAVKNAKTTTNVAKAMKRAKTMKKAPDAMKRAKTTTKALKAMKRAKTTTTKALKAMKRAKTTTKATKAMKGPKTTTKKAPKTTKAPKLLYLNKSDDGMEEWYDGNTFMKSWPRAFVKDHGDGELYKWHCTKCIVLKNKVKEFWNYEEL